MRAYRPGGDLRSLTRSITVPFSLRLLEKLSSRATWNVWTESVRVTWPEMAKSLHSSAGSLLFCHPGAQFLLTQASHSSADVHNLKPGTPRWCGVRGLRRAGGPSVWLPERTYRQGQECTGLGFVEPTSTLQAAPRELSLHLWADLTWSISLHPVASTGTALPAENSLGEAQWLAPKSLCV